jgi:hypothetical protein
MKEKSKHAPAPAPAGKPFEKRSCEKTKPRKLPQKLFAIRGPTSDYSHLGIDFASPHKSIKTLGNGFFHSFKNTKGAAPHSGD